MHLSRRSFLVGSSLAALASSRLVSARGSSSPSRRSMTSSGASAARRPSAGATYADIRIVAPSPRGGRDARGSHRARVVERPGVRARRARVIAGGAWGFSATPIVSSPRPSVSRGSRGRHRGRPTRRSTPCRSCSRRSRRTSMSGRHRSSRTRSRSHSKTRPSCCSRSTARRQGPGVKFATASYRGDRRVGSCSPRPSACAMSSKSFPCASGRATR